MSEYTEKYRALHDFAERLAEHLPGWRYNKDKQVDSDGDLCFEAELVDAREAAIYVQTAGEGRFGFSAKVSFRYELGGQSESWVDSGVLGMPVQAKGTVAATRALPEVARMVLKHIAPVAVESRRRFEQAIASKLEVHSAQRSAVERLLGTGYFEGEIDLDGLREDQHVVLRGPLRSEVRVFRGWVKFEFGVDAETAVDVAETMRVVANKRRET